MSQKGLFGNVLEEPICISFCLKNHLIKTQLRYQNWFLYDIAPSYKKWSRTEADLKYVHCEFDLSKASRIACYLMKLAS